MNPTGLPAASTSPAGVAGQLAQGIGAALPLNPTAGSAPKPVTPSPAAAISHVTSAGAAALNQGTTALSQAGATSFAQATTAATHGATTLPASTPIVVPAPPPKICIVSKQPIPKDAKFRETAQGPVLEENYKKYEQMLSALQSGFQD